MIDYVLKKTKRNSLHFVGHSMGGALFMILMATQPEYATKIKTAFLLAPAMVVGNSFSTSVQTAVTFYPTLKVSKFHCVLYFIDKMQHMRPYCIMRITMLPCNK